MLIAIDTTLESVERMMRAARAGKLDRARCLREIEQQMNFLSFKLAESAGSQAEKGSLPPPKSVSLTTGMSRRMKIAFTSRFRPWRVCVKRLRMRGCHMPPQ